MSCCLPLRSYNLLTGWSFGRRCFWVKYLKFISSRFRPKQCVAVDLQLVLNVLLLVLPSVCGLNLRNFTLSR